MKTRFLCAAIAFSVAAPFAQSHAKVELSQPKPDSVLTVAPKEIRLQFNEVLEPAFSKIALTDGSGANIALPKVELDKANPKGMLAALPSLKPGQYQVHWSAMGHDGHKTKGEFAFRLK